MNIVILAAGDFPRKAYPKYLLESADALVCCDSALESALKRFKRQCARSGVIQEVRKREHYEKPSVKRKKKAEAARKRKY